jgi:hypothetical protein
MHHEAIEILGLLDCSLICWFYLTITHKTVWIIWGAFKVPHKTLNTPHQSYTVENYYYF